MTPEDDGPSLALVAWFDGWEQAQRPDNRATFRRPLNAHEMAQWRKGWATGKRDRAATT